jgi:hypothetical protein
LITSRSIKKKSLIQEFNKSPNFKRFLNSDVRLGSYSDGSKIATLNIPLGTSQDITYPNINDDHPYWVDVSQSFGSMPHVYKIT